MTYEVDQQLSNSATNLKQSDQPLLNPQGDVWVDTQWPDVSV
jgi:hypothetical protein